MYEDERDQVLFAIKQQWYSPGQAGRVQTSVFFADPVQSLPPLAGAGLLHFLVLVRVPLPQVTKQTPSPKSDQLPSTVKNSRK